MKRLNRAASFLMALIMVLSLLPASAIAAEAAEEPVVVIAGSDFQASSDSVGADNVKSILAQVVKEYPSADGFLFAGDYDKDDVAYANSAAGKAALQEALQGVYGAGMHEVYVQGNHDKDSLVGSTLSPSGANDPESGAYGVFVINEKDYMWYNNDESTIKAAAASLKSYLDEKVAAKADEPIFVISHLPLHYSMRTKQDGDGQHANLIFDVLNQGGEAGLNIIFLFGHNHSHGWDDYLGGAAIYLEKGDKINIAQGSKDTYKEETLNFTYMNAGYVGYYRNVNTGAETDLTMTVFAITGDKVTVERYSASDKHELKSAGVKNAHAASTSYVSDGNGGYCRHNLTEDYAPNTEVYPSAQTIELQKFEADGPAAPESVTKVDVPSGVMVTAPGLTGLQVTATPREVEGYSAYVSYEIIPIGYTQGDKAEVTVALDMTRFDASRPVEIVDVDGETSGETEITMLGVVGTITFTTDHFSVYDVRQAAEDEGDGLTWVEAVPYSDSYVYQLDTDGVTAGGQYLIASGGSGEVALLANNGSNTPGSLSVRVSADGKISLNEADNAKASWIFSGSTSGTVKNSTRYVYLDSNVLSTSSRTLTINNRGSGAYRLYWTSGWLISTTYYLRYNNGWGRATDANNVYLYELKLTPGPAVFVAMEGPDVYTVSAGTTSAAALNAVKSGVTVYTATDAQGTGKTVLDDGSLVWDIRGYTGRENNVATVTISYKGVVLGEKTVEVEKKRLDQDPAYPNPGSVDVNKTAKGLDFQNTGVARVELSTSGLPAGQGADVVIVIDTSTSMRDYAGSRRRIDILSDSLEDTLTKFQAANPTTGVVSDIDVAIIDFNGYHLGSAADYDKMAMPNGGYRNNTDNAKVFTGTNAGQYIRTYGLSADNFVDATSLTPNTVAGQFNYNNCSSGTNYDGALENAYTLLAAKKARNEENREERDQYVIFLSDGAPFRYNGLNNQDDGDNYDKWNEWLSGSWTDENDMLADYPNQTFTYSYFYNGNGDTHPHRWAEAIKGDVNTDYDVVQRSAADNDPAYIEQYKGLGAKIYAIGFGLADDYDVVKATQMELIRAISSGEGYYNDDVTDADELNAAFNRITTEVSAAAREAYFIDEMGDGYDLQMNPVVKTNAAVSGGTTSVNTDITVTVSDVYNRVNAPSTDLIGAKVPGSEEPLETVSFQVSGGQIVATSTARTEADGNILNNGVIEGQYFYYNTTANPVKVTLVNGQEYDLPGEAFCWNIGTIDEKQYTLSYTVYLTGSMEGKCAEGDSYSTNGPTTLHYINYLGNKMEKDASSPTMPWGGANVSYAFYLVDENGNPLDENGNRTDNFLTAYKVTSPVLYKSIKLNSEETMLSTEGRAVLPYGYVLYDADAVYTVEVASGDGGGSWKIKMGDNGVTDPEAADYYEAGNVKDFNGVDRPDVATTYVVNYSDNSDAYSKDLSANNDSYDYTHTTVYFAVLWTIGTLPDTVVIDYGLSVDISVLANDMFGTSGNLKAVGRGEDKPSADHTAQLAAGFAESAGGDYGTMTMNKDEMTGLYESVRYTPNTMQMSGPDKMAYAVQYSGANSGYYYGDVTVIPATSIYYEDNFSGITYGRYDNDTNEISGKWEDVGTVTDATQAEDRPGQYSLPAIDGNNIYGYDKVYAECGMYSMNSAKMVHVDADSYGKVNFSFTGTGFDMVSLTSNTTGTFAVRVYEAGTTNRVKVATVNTYYGYIRQFDAITYTYTDGVWVESRTSISEETYRASVSQTRPEEPSEGSTYTVYKESWVLGDSEDENAIYQVPVLKIEDLAYGAYDVEIIATYIEFFDDTAPDGYDLYLDAIRVYDPTGNLNEEANDAYVEDHEGWPTYIELRNNIIEAAVIEEGGSIPVINGVVFIDGVDKVSAVADYTDCGPNNEVYLAAGQAVVFNLDMASYANVDKVHIGLKSADGAKVSYKIFDGTTIENKEDLEKINTKTVETAAEMYYDITDLRNASIVVYNAGESGILSLTEVKVTFESAPAEVGSLLYVSPEVVKKIVENLSAEAPAPATFEPGTFTVSAPERVYAGNTITVTVTTSSDVEAIYVEGTLVKSYYARGGQRIWTAKVSTKAVESKTISVIAYNDEGIASVEKTVTVNVQALTVSNVVTNVVAGVLSGVKKVLNSILKWF